MRKKGKKKEKADKSKKKEKKVCKTFGKTNKMLYLCNRKSEMMPRCLG